MTGTLSVFPPPPRHAPRFVLATSPFDLPVACPASSFSWASLLSHRRRRLRLHRGVSIVAAHKIRGKSVYLLPGFLLQQANSGDTCWEPRSKDTSGTSGTSLLVKSGVALCPNLRPRPSPSPNPNPVTPTWSACEGCRYSAPHRNVVLAGAASTSPPHGDKAHTGSRRDSASSPSSALSSTSS